MLVKHVLSHIDHHVVWDIARDILRQVLRLIGGNLLGCGITLIISLQLLAIRCDLCLHQLTRHLLEHHGRCMQLLPQGQQLCSERLRLRHLHLLDWAW